ncbi:hypothetical protein Nepgr_019573 [Nepenthes gracilis]|uniref:Uncharacterized protein n=1 Tax=Nepenthes gracilis TaxID=150966 RepID=A0AAD3SWC6_NEPGR|nr:hypothetical protein Nepgr_019573 [Nepenthes gracilis]
MASSLPPHLPAASDVSVQGNLEMVSDIPMTEDVASAPPSVVVGDCQSALLFACSESNLVESKLKEECDCSSSGSESASSLLPPSSSAEVVGLDTNLSEEDRYAALGDSPKAMESWCCVLLRDAESDWSIAADAVMIYTWANALLYGTSEARVVDWR